MKNKKVSINTDLQKTYIDKHSKKYDAVELNPKDGNYITYSQNCHFSVDKSVNL